MEAYNFNEFYQFLRQCKLLHSIRYTKLPFICCILDGIEYNDGEIVNMLEFTRACDDIYVTTKPEMHTIQPIITYFVNYKHSLSQTEWRIVCNICHVRTTSLRFPAYQTLYRLFVSCIDQRIFSYLSVLHPHYEQYIIQNETIICDMQLFITLTKNLFCDESNNCDHRVDFCRWLQGMQLSLDQDNSFLDGSNDTHKQQLDSCFHVWKFSVFCLVHYIHASNNYLSTYWRSRIKLDYTQTIQLFLCAIGDTCRDRNLLTSAESGITKSDLN